MFLLVVCPVLFCTTMQKCSYLSKSTGMVSQYRDSDVLSHTVSVKLALMAVLDAAPHTGVTVPEGAQSNQVGTVFIAGTGTCVLHTSWVNATGSLRCSVNSLKDDKRGACSPSFPSESKVQTFKVMIFFYDLD